jgi:hypothetical protein
LLWVFWRPSAASNVDSFSLALIVQFFYGLFNSSLIVYAFQYPAWKCGILALLLAAALGFGCRSLMRRSERPLSDVALLGMLCATILLMLALAAGRSKYQSWAPGLEMHYGFLTIIMPIVSWIIVSSNVNRKTQVVVGVLLVALFARAFMANWNWRFTYVANSWAKNRAVQREIAAGGKAQNVVQKNIRALFFVDTPLTRSVVTSGIEILRQHGGRQYR